MAGLPQEQAQQGCSLTPEQLQREIEEASQALQSACSRQEGWPQLQQVISAAADVCRHCSNSGACPQVRQPSWAAMPAELVRPAACCELQMDALRQG